MDKIKLIPSLPLQYGNQHQIKQDKPKLNFQELFSHALHLVDASQKESADMTNKLVTGEINDLHQVTIAAQKASITLDLTLQVRNKVVEAYQEIMRMQM